MNSKKIIFFTFFLCIAVPSFAHHGVKCSRAFAATTQPVLWPDYPRRPFNVLRYQLTLDWRKIFETKSQKYSGVNFITLVVSDTTSNITLDAGLMKIDTIQINGVSVFPVPQPTSDEHLIIPLPLSLQNPGSQVSLKIAYHKDTLLNLGIYFYPKGMYDSYGRDTIEQDIVYTMSEPTDAHFWMPCMDQPYDKAESEISIIAPNDIETASNGSLLSKHAYSPTSTIWHWKSDEPIATYLMTADASNFIHWSQTHQRTSAPGDTVHLDYYAWPEDYYQDSIKDGSKYNAQYFLSRNTSQIMTWEENHYGGFPFEKYGQVPVAPFAFGGMEHQTLTTIHRQWLKGDDQGIAHEMAHQWFGDKTTCETFKDIWLNEGFATYSEAIWGESWGGNVWYMNIIRDDKANGYFYGDNSFPVYDPPADNLFNYATTYCKGACVLHMLRRMINNDTMFFNALRDYSNAFAYTTANTVQFRDYIGQRLGLDLYEYIDQWIFGALHPEYNIKWAESPNNTLYLRINQTQTVRDHFTMPMKFFAYHGSLIDTLTFVNDLRSQAFQKNMNYAIDSLTLDTDALILSRNSTNLTIFKDSTHMRDTTISKNFLYPILTYSPALIPSSASSQLKTNSSLMVFREGNNLLCRLGDAAQNGTLELHNSLGMKIQNAAIANGERFKKFDIRNLPSGIYFIRYIHTTEVEVQSVNITK